MNLESLTKKRADLAAQLEQHVGQINRINGAVAVLDDLIKEWEAEQREGDACPTMLGIDRSENPFWKNYVNAAPAELILTPAAPDAPLVPEAAPQMLPVVREESEEGELHMAPSPSVTTRPRTVQYDAELDS